MATIRAKTPATAEQYEQLTLLAPSNVPLQFRLDERTRRRGLARLAEIRRQLAAQAARRAESTRPGQRAA